MTKHEVFLGTGRRSRTSAGARKIETIRVFQSSNYGTAN